MGHKFFNTFHKRKKKSHDIKDAIDINKLNNIVENSEKSCNEADRFFESKGMPNIYPDYSNPKIAKRLWCRKYMHYLKEHNYFHNMN